MNAAPASPSQLLSSSRGHGADSSRALSRIPRVDGELRRVFRGAIDRECRYTLFHSPAETAAELEATVRRLARLRRPREPICVFFALEMKSRRGLGLLRRVLSTRLSPDARRALYRLAHELRAPPMKLLASAMPPVDLS